MSIHGTPGVESETTLVVRRQQLHSEWVVGTSYIGGTTIRVYTIYVRTARRTAFPSAAVFAPVCFLPAYTGPRHVGENQQTGALRAIRGLYDWRRFSEFSSAAQYGIHILEILLTPVTARVGLAQTNGPGNNFLTGPCSQLTACAMEMLELNNFLLIQWRI